MLESTNRWIGGAEKHRVVIRVGNVLLQWAAEYFADVVIGQDEIVVDCADRSYDFRPDFMRLFI